MPLSRRTMLSVLGSVPLGSAPLLNLSFNRKLLAQSIEPPADILVCVFQRGGVDGLNMIVPYGDAEYYNWRPQIGIAPPDQADGVIDLDGFFGLHPALEPLKPIYDLGDLAVVHATGSPHDTRSHFDAQDFMERAYLEKGGLFSGWIGRHLESVSQGEQPFCAVGMGGATQQSLQGEGLIVPVAINDITAFGINSSDPAVPLVLDEIYSGTDPLSQQAQQALDAAEQLAQYDPAQNPPDNGAEYPDSEFGQALLQAGQLIKTEGLGVKAICIDVGGWDTHESENPALEGLLADFAAALAAFHTDMGSRMANISLVIESEFGRRVYENAALGTDHGHGNCMLLLGGGVNGGAVYADWPGLADTQLYGNGDLQVTTDWRVILGELVSKRLLNNDLETVFPDFAMPGFLGVFQ